MNNSIGRLFLTIIIASIVTGCASLGDTPAEKRSSILEMKNQVLTQLFAEKPSARGMIESAPGYAVFDNGNINLLVVSFGGGYGVAKNNQTGRYTYMKVAEAGVGPGAGVKDFSVVIVFHTKEALQRFINKGWQFGAHADAAAKAGKKGAAASAEAMVDSTTVFTLTKSGLALQAQLKGIKFWKDDELN